MVLLLFFFSKKELCLRKYKSWIQCFEYADFNNNFLAKVFYVKGRVAVWSKARTKQVISWIVTSSKITMAFYFFKVVINFTSNFQGKLPLFGNFRKIRLLFLVGHCHKEPFKLGVIGVLLRALSKNWSWKSQFYLVNLSTLGSQVRIPDFLSHFWASMILFLRL